MKNTTGYKAINLFFVVFHAFTTAERKNAVGLGPICPAEYLPDNRLLLPPFFVPLLGFEEPCFFEVTDSAADGGGRILELGGYGRDALRIGRCTY